MISFKEFIAEKIYVDGDAIKITYASFKDKLPHDEIDNHVRSNGALYKAKALGSDVEVKSLYIFHSDSTTALDIVKSLKHAGKYKVDDKTYFNFLRKSALGAKKFIASHEIDTVVFPSSSSTITKDFVEELKDVTTKKIEFHSDVFVKRRIKEITSNADRVTDNDVTDLINIDHPKFDTLDAKTIKSLEKSLVKIINDNIKSGEGATLSMKRIFKKNAIFVHNFLEIAKEFDKQFIGKKVLIIDDVLSTGVSISEMVHQLEKIAKPSSILGLTLFKSTSTNNHES